MRDSGHWRDPLSAFCAKHGPGFRLEWDAHPAEREDAIGLKGATSHAQLCEGNIISARPQLDALHSISHEIGHAMAAHVHGEHKREDEHLAAVEQCFFLVQLSRHLLTATQGNSEG